MEGILCGNQHRELHVAMKTLQLLGQHQTSNPRRVRLQSALNL